MRELISNASDATEQVRFAISTNPDKLVKFDSKLEIRIYTDPGKNTLTIQVYCFLDLNTNVLYRKINMFLAIFYYIFE